jgi:hypothetical protein
MGSLLTLILPALLPAAIDAVKGVFGAAQRRFLGLSVDDQIKLEGAQVERLKAVSELDKVVGSPSQWVVDLRASFRYIAAGISILCGIGLGYVGLFSVAVTNEELLGVVLPLSMDLIGIPFSFIFGERLYLGLKGSVK